MKRKTCVSIVIGLLLIGLMTCWQTWRSPLGAAHGSPDVVNIDTNLEYSNGTLSSRNPDLPFWYDWINVSGTEIIFLAYQSHVVNPPIITFLGQHYHAENETEVFVGNTLTSMEVYNDTNGNGLPDADYSKSSSEILYFFDVNSSVSFETSPIEKTLIEGEPHYTWGMRYQTIDGFLTSEGYSPVASVMVDYIDFSYDFHIQNNVSYVKTDFGIGKILEITPFSNVASAPFSLDGLSLALFYGTVVITSKPYVTLVNGNPYNSTTAPASTEAANLSEIRIHDATTYKFVFGQNYTLFRESGQEAYESKSTAVSDQSVSSGLQRFEWVFSDMESVLSDLFPRISSMQAAIDLDYTVSSFLYRVCYPKWDGSAIEHDPTYIAYLSVGTVPEMSLPLVFTIGIAAASTAALMSALFDLRRTRKITRYSRTTPTESTPQNLR